MKDWAHQSSDYQLWSTCQFCSLKAFHLLYLESKGANLNCYKISSLVFSQITWKSLVFDHLRSVWALSDSCCGWRSLGWCHSFKTALWLIWWSCWSVDRPKFFLGRFLQWLMSCVMSVFIVCCRFIFNNYISIFLIIIKAWKSVTIALWLKMIKE